MVGVAILTFVYLFGALEVIGTSKSKAGPYMVRPETTGRCKNMSPPRLSNPVVTFMVEIYNTSKKYHMLRGNVTIHRQNYNLLVKVKNFIWEDGKWKLVYLYNHAGCNSPWLRKLMETYGMRYDNCSIAKGVYSYENVDNNIIEHFWGENRVYGRSRYRIECCTKQKVLDDCWETINLVMPI